MSDEKKIRKQLTTVQKVNLYTMLCKLHDNGTLKTMTYDDILRKCNEDLGFPLNYGHVKNIIKETGWEVHKLRRTEPFLKSDLAEDIKALEAVIADNTASIGLLQEQIKKVSSVSEKSFENFKDMTEAKFQTILDTLRHFEKRIVDLERRAGFNAIPTKLPPRL